MLFTSPFLCNKLNAGKDITTNKNYGEILLMKLKFIVLALLFAVATIFAASTTKYEENRLELIKPTKAGVLLLRPTFHSCSFYFGSDKLNAPVVEFRKKGEKWRKAFTPEHYFENKNTVTGLVMNEYRGSIVKLEENTCYEVRFKDGNKILKTGKFTTWKTDVPIKKTIYIDTEKFKSPYIISANGTPDGWIRYTSKNGKTIRGNGTKPVFIVKNAKYVLLDDMTIIGSSGSQSVIKLEKSQGVRIRNCDISGWGRIGKVKFDTDHLRGAYWYQDKRGRWRAINYDGAIYIYPGNKEIVVERCYIHDPVSHANSWYYCHPAGPQAIVCTKPDHSTVIRYNDFIGSDLHRFNDAFEGPGNFHSNGGINRDADVYGNYMIYCNDDCIELDGGQQNVRCFWNHFEGALCGVSIQGCMTSPVYVFENIFGGICGEFGESNASIKTSGKNGIKPMSYIFNNTFCGTGSGFRFHNELISIVKNNLMLDTQTISCLHRLTEHSKLSSNTVCKVAQKHNGIEKYNSKLVNHLHGNYAPADVPAAEHIDNFCEKGSVRGALQNDGMVLPYRPIPVILDRTRIEGVKINKGKALPAEIKITATVGGKNFKSAYTINKNKVFEWLDITPAKGILKSGDKITFTVKFIPEKMNNRQFYRGAFSLRLADGFSRVVAVYAESDYHQPFKLEKPGETAIYVNDALTPDRVFSSKNEKQSAKVKIVKSELGLNGKVAVSDNRKVFEYKINVPQDGRYYLMIRGYAPKGRCNLEVAVNNSSKGISIQQVVTDRMRWTMLVPNFYHGKKAEFFDLKKGVTTVRIKGAGFPLHFDGIALVSNPESFEPR